MHYLLILLPIVWFLSSRLIWKNDINFQEVFVSCVITTLIVLGVTEASKMDQADDVEFWNGAVTSKAPIKKACHTGWSDYSDSFCRHEDTRSVYSHTEPYSCGTSKQPRTCTRDVYKTQYKAEYPWEQNWKVRSTVGNYEIRRIDRQGSREPPRWTEVKVGDGVSETHTYTNFIKAIDNSIFNNISVKSKFDAKVPAYPTVHDYYRVNRVIPVEYTDPKIPELNRLLSSALGRMNPHKQVNVNIIMTSIQDKSFKHSVERKWLGGKKNDVTIFLGMNPDKKTFSWVDAMTFGMNDFNGIMLSTLKGSIHDLGTIESPENFIKTIEKVIVKHYDKPSMETYAHLEHEIKPTTAALWVAFILNVIACIGLSLSFKKHDLDVIKPLILSIKRKLNL